MDILPVVLEKDGVPVTTSKAVADQFDKRHADILRAIEDLKPHLTTQFCVANFFKSEYESRGKSYPYYIMTKDGFTMLVMGFTGAKAIQFKEAYITAFNQMQRALLGGGVSAPAPALQEHRTPLRSSGTGYRAADNRSIKGGAYLLTGDQSRYRQRGILHKAEVQAL